MNLGSFLMGVGIFLLCLSPFVLTQMNRIKKERQAIQQLKNKAQEHNGKLTKHEYCGDFALGIDESQKFVFFYKKKEENGSITSIDLREVQKCLFNVHKRGTTIIKVELSFILKNSKNDVNLELYNETLNGQLNGEPLLAESWSKLVNERLV